MADFVIPREGNFANYNFLTTLDGIRYRLSFEYNARDAAWYLDFLSEDNVTLRSGIKLVSNFPVLLRWVDVENRPPGEILAYDPRTLTAPATLDELGDTVILTYSDEATFG